MNTDEGDAREKVIRDEFTRLFRKDYPENYETVPLTHLGIDSLDFFETLANLEQDHGIVIQVQDLDEQISLRDIIRLVK